METNVITKPFDYKERFAGIVSYIKSLYNETSFIPLHEPLFQGKEKEYVIDAIDSTFVSSVGRYVTLFEQMMADIAGTRYAVATVNGTSALHVALLVSGVQPGDEVLTQALTFVATANAISYAGASPVFIDVDADTMGLSPEMLNSFLEKNGEISKDRVVYNKQTGKVIRACVAMHTMGFPCRIDGIKEVCDRWNIKLIEDAAESIGTYYKSQHTGSFGAVGTFSFNGNKTVTCGGGGAVVTSNERMATLAKHITTQAKKTHAWEYVHDMIGYNYRMPNLNAAMACAQLENLQFIVSEKRRLAAKYRRFFAERSIKFIDELPDAKANFWLNSISFPDKAERDEFLKLTNSEGVMTRPLWQLMFRLPMFSHCQKDKQTNAIQLEETVVNIPSGVAGLKQIGNE